jgi:poly-gamma-glutamate system protein
MASVEFFKVEIKQPYYKEKIQAARLMKRGMEIIREYRVRHVGPIDSEIDPANSGLIGLPESPITSTVGLLPAKQTTLNPNWGAVLVQMFKKAGANEGDVAAMGFSGSFPALNLAALSAAEVLKLKVVAISSTTASAWGANIPSLTWLDMERVLYNKGLISYRSAAASLGGLEDRAMAGSKKMRQLLREAVERNKTNFIDIEDSQKNIDTRMETYHGLAEGKRIAVYVNVGGGTVSVGRAAGKKLYKPGLNRKPSRLALSVESVMSRFAREGIPVIHMVYINELAGKYGLPQSLNRMPKVGEGNIFLKLEYNFHLVTANLLILICVLYVFLRRDIGYRIFGSSRITQTPKHPEPMV